MLKFLIIFFAIFYLLYKVGGFLLRGFFVSSTTHQTPPHQKKSQKVPNSDLNIDYMPKDRKKSKKDFDGGEYVDYEEV
jgi:hypothetical protein